MQTPPSDRSHDSEILEAWRRERDEILSVRDATITRLEQQIQRLLEPIKLLTHKRFAASSEQHPGQGQLFNEAEDLWVPEVLETPVAPAGDTDTPKASTRRGRKPLSKDLPRVRVVHDLPEAEKICGGCGTALPLIGEDCTESLDYIPAQIQVIEHVHLKYGCRGCTEGVVTAKAPKGPIKGGILSPNLLAHVMVSKHEHSLPLYRQETLFAELGVTLSRSTLSHGMIQGAAVLMPLYATLQDILRHQPILHADETTVPVLHEPGRTPQSQSSMWLYCTGREGPPIVLYDYQPTRAGSHPRAFLAGFTGHLQVDGYAAYDTLPDVTLVACWAHCRRKFDEALKAQPKGDIMNASRARKAMDQIGALYGIEREIVGLTAQERTRIRHERARPLVADFHAWLLTVQGKVLPKGLLGQVVSYTLRQWEKLERYLEDGRLEIDNNRAERAIKPFVIGRKNWMFSNTPNGAHASAVLYSLIATAKANGLVPFDYLRHLLTVLPNLTRADEVEQLLPWKVMLPKDAPERSPGTC